MERGQLHCNWKHDGSAAFRKGWGEDNVLKVFSSYVCRRYIAKDIDIDFVGLSFLNINSATVENLVLPRKMWVELRGVPISTWSEDNFFNLVKEKGKMLEISPIVTEDHLMGNPKVLLETKKQYHLDWWCHVIIDDHQFNMNVSKCFARAYRYDFKEQTENCVETQNHS